MFPAIFVLKYKTKCADSRTSEMVHDGSQAKRVSWKEHYRNVHKPVK